MARKLPWKRQNEAPEPSTSRSARTSAAQSPASSASRPAAQPERRHVVRTPVSRRHVQRVLDSDPVRSPSTSPPPQRPHEEFMIPGVLNDDKYRMVEDEFLRIAQRFTAHLHRAEYDRLKALAKAQNADTIREIERPIVPDTVPTARTRQRTESRQRALKQRRALAADGRGDEDRKAKTDAARSPVAATGLRGLMEAPRREGRAVMPAVSASSASSRTRAAAGYSSKSLPQHDSRSREPSPSLPPLPSSVQRVKLELPASPRSTSVSSRSTSQHPRASSSDVQATPSSAIKAQKETPASERRIPGQRPRVHVLDDDDDDPFGLHERRMSRKKTREESGRSGAKGNIKYESNTVDLTSIPSFL
ncbi:hypothetical protein TgHK011_004338 [Trichoderma gracile]|nr:hypothetical protein TgHK011_004338 [Trichoderma gracile]